ncbi:MAG: hypothetical protein KKF44_01450, partial [Nanoarchaeota archaeon]|nr:hypothetical protein [Nanoarchaeota archaeon]
KTAVTGSDGSYKIEGLEPGNYEFWEDMKPGWEPVTAQRFIGTVVAGNSCTQANFKNKEIVIPGCIEGYKKDTENIGLPLWKITATRTDDSSVKYTAMTDSEGRYKMTGVQSGTYTITETMQSGWDVADGYSLSYTKTVNPGDSCTLVNFKNKQVPTEGCVEGIKRDDNHVGLSGWTIHAKKIGQPDSSGKTAVTGSDGSYKINGLEPGTYEFWEDMKTGWEPVTAQRFIGTVSAGNSCTQANFKNKVLCECDPSDVCCNEDCKYYPEGHQPDGMYDFEYDYCSMHDLMIKKVDYYCPGSSGDYEVKETNELKKDCTTLDNCESWNYFCKMDDSTREQTCHDFTCVETSTSVSCESESRTEKIVDECDNPFCEDDNYYCLENDVYKDRTCFTGGCNDETGRCKDVNPYEEDEFVEACGDDFCDDSNTELDIYIKEYIMDEDSCDNGQCMPDTGRSDDFCSDSSTLHQVTCNGLDKGPDDIVDCSSLTGCYAVPMEECFGSCSRYQHCNGGRCDYPTEMMVYKDFGCSNGACTYDEDDFVDTDTDYIDDRCDSCIDTDHDGICDDDDNCPTVWNSHQRDDDHDGLGDLCDTDVDGDGYLPPEDCNDYDPEVNPGMDEIPYNGQDDDCSDETEDMPGSVPKQTAFVDLTILNEERLVPGDIMEVFIEVNNIGRYDQKGVSVNGYVTSYGIRARRDLGDLRKGKSKTTVLYIEIPENAKPGFNYLRVNINNDEFSRTIIREFWLNK